MKHSLKARRRPMHFCAGNFDRARAFLLVLPPPHFPGVDSPRGDDAVSISRHLPPSRRQWGPRMKNCFSRRHDSSASEGAMTRKTLLSFFSLCLCDFPLEKCRVDERRGNFPFFFRSVCIGRENEGKVNIRSVSISRENSVWRRG